MPALALAACFGVLSIANNVAGRSALQMIPSAMAAGYGNPDATKSGAEFRDCASCPAMIVIPAGRFDMGSAKDDPDARSNERPQHRVTIARPIAVAKFEATFGEWDTCVAAGACPQVPDSWGRGQMPVINVSWNDAQQYAAWLSRVTGKPYRLLTEAEWEYAARAGAATRYPWGDGPGEGEANCDGCGSRWDLRQTAPVGSFKANGFGLYDMQGNVWEWIEDPAHANYEGAPRDGSAWGQGDPSYRIVRGGSWRNETSVIRAAVRDKRNFHVAFDTLGFRVARALSP